MNKNICVKKGVFRLEEGKFTLMYEKENNDFFIGLKNISEMNKSDLVDLNNLTKEMLNLIDNE